MDSVTKPLVTAEQVGRISEKHLGGSPTDVRELTDGWFNAAFMVAVPEGEFVLKVAPPDGVRVLRYERGMMAAEAGATRLVRERTDLPAPRVVAFDQGREEIASDYMLAERVPGLPLDQARGTLSQGAEERAERELGAFTRTLHGVRGEAFGTFGDAVHGVWTDAFAHLLEDLERDASDAGVDLPSGAFACAAPHLGALSEANVPCLIHWDLWDPNVFVSPEDGRVTGIIDFERAMWADPLMEARFKHATPAFFKGYGGDPREAPGARVRRALYDLHLGLVMTIESTYRRFTSEHEGMCRASLDEAIRVLGDLP